MNQFAWQTSPENISEEQVLQTVRADVVVVGAGHAGTCAARAAAEAGASVIVLEQQSEGRQRILGIGEIGHINSRWQAEHGVAPVDVDEFVNAVYLMSGSFGGIPFCPASLSSVLSAGGLMNSAPLSRILVYFNIIN